MTCPVCGTPHPCAHSRGKQTLLADREISGKQLRPAAGQNLLSPATEARSRAEQEYWRQEVALRVRQHRARRRRFNPNASLELDFPADAALAIASDTVPPALSLSLPAGELMDLAEPVRILESPTEEPAARPQLRKIIRFPRYAAIELHPAPLPQDLELAEPAPESPRILDAPEAEQMDLLPSFADMRLEEPPQEKRLREELDLLPQPAPLLRRLASGAVDGAIVLLAAGLFAATFGKLAESVPPARAAMLCALAVGGTLWLLFQYLFLVYGNATPGMRAAQLELLTFDGRPASVFARRVRALATALSGFSVGLGFAWALVDEDTLGWHDRISQTYLKSS